MLGNKSVPTGRRHLYGSSCPNAIKKGPARCAKIYENECERVVTLPEKRNNNIRNIRNFNHIKTENRRDFNVVCKIIKIVN